MEWSEGRYVGRYRLLKGFGVLFQIRLTAFFQSPLTWKIKRGIGQTPKKTIFTLLREITLAPFLKETGQNSRAPERSFMLF